MMDAIANTAPQSTEMENMAAQGSDSSAQDGAQFTKVLDTAIKDDEHERTNNTQAEDAGRPAEQSTKQATEQTDSKDAQKSTEELTAQLAAAVNMQITKAVQTVSGVDSPKVEATDDSTVAAAQTLPELANAETSTTSAGVSISDELLPIAVNSAANTPMQEAMGSANAEGSGSKSMFVDALPAEGTVKATTKDTDVAKLARPGAAADVNAVDTQKSADILKVQQAVIEHKAQNGSAPSSQMRIEVTASVEPPREFTIKPQVINPVSNQVNGIDSLINGAVTKVASTEKGSMNPDTPGSGTNGQTNTYAAQVMLDPVAKQATQTQVAQTASTTEQPLHTRVIDQIIQEVKLIKLPQQSDLVVRLSPPELGTLRVQITQVEQGMTAQIQTSGEQVRGLLQAHLPALNQALSNVGLKMDSVSVTSGLSFGTLMQDTTQGGAQHQFSGQRQHYSGSRDANGIQTMINMPEIAGVDNTAYSWLA